MTWVVNGYENTEANEPVRSADGLVSDAEGTPAVGGDTLGCVVQASDGEAQGEKGESNTLVLENSAPIGGSVQVDPAEASEETTLSCVAEGATDPDGQEVTWAYIWIVNGAQLVDEKGETLESGFFGAGDSVTCIATPSDGEDSGEPVEADNTVAIANTLPTPPTVGISPEEGTVVTEFSCPLITPGDDVDGDLLTYEKRWVVNGFVNPLWQEPAKPINLVSDEQGTQSRGGDTFSCQVRAYDGLGYSELASSALITLENSAPSGGSVYISPPEAAAGVTLTCEASGASDADGDEIPWSYAWYAGDALIVGQTDETLTSDYFGSGDIVRCEATATDGEASGPLLQSEMRSRSVTRSRAPLRSRSAPRWARWRPPSAAPSPSPPRTQTAMS